ncbi:hypothetical protein M5J20_08375 [Corynebacterium sp. TA-R-1]|uniref:Uncharacterized protein n=1 Tax=Corynebacterium stercoris TaxID=2943490 RepID=A0ABT1G2F2_9CORY|nr:hypothetical protein [Corynebacterium stercoris]MCP1388199.1 hypothetical protein [Corynebacterium stercoris]
MAKAVRPRRIVIAASVLSLALAAPLVTVPEAGFLPVAEAVEAGDFASRYETGNFWNANEAPVQGLQLAAGDNVEVRGKAIWDWKVRNDGGTLKLIRPQSAPSFKTGNVDIGVRVTPAGGQAFNTTLKVNVVDSMPQAAWEGELPSENRQVVDFDGGRSKAIAALPAGVRVRKVPGFDAVGAVGWDVAAENGNLVIKAPGTFTENKDVDIPVEYTDGTSSYQRWVRITPKGPQTSGSDIRDGIGGVIGSIIGGATGAGGGLVRVEVHPSAVNITGNGSNNGNPSVVITNNANPTVEIRDNGSNNGSNNTVQITGNANPVITGNANPTVNVEVKDNGSNNTVSGNGVVQPSAVVVTGNANPSNNGSNNSAVVSGNGVVQPSAVVVTGNANPVVTGNANNNGSNNAVNAKVEPSAVVVKDNGSNNQVVITGNATDLLGRGAKKDGTGGDAAGSSAATGGIQDPRCIASLAALGIPLAAMIPLALAQTLNLPALDASAAIAAGAFDEIVAQFGLTPAAINGFAGGVVGVVLAAIVAAAAVTCSPKAATITVPATVTQVVATEPTV